MSDQVPEDLLNAGLGQQEPDDGNDELPVLGAGDSDGEEIAGLSDLGH